MALLDLLKGLTGFSNDDGVIEPWAEDPTVFRDHFGVPFDEFEERLSNLDRAHIDLYEKTLRVNPEAAVTWVFWIAQT